MSFAMAAILSAVVLFLGALITVAIPDTPSIRAHLEKHHQVLLLKIGLALWLTSLTFVILWLMFLAAGY